MLGGKKDVPPGRAYSHGIPLPPYSTTAARSVPYEGVVGVLPASGRVDLGVVDSKAESSSVNKSAISSNRASVESFALHALASIAITLYVKSSQIDLMSQGLSV